MSPDTSTREPGESVVEWRLKVLEQQNREILAEMRAQAVEMRATVADQALVYVRNDTYKIKHEDLEDRIRVAKEESEKRDEKILEGLSASKSRQDNFRYWGIGIIASPVLSFIVYYLIGQAK